MKIEVAYALPEEQFLYVEEVDDGCTVEEALAHSTFLQEHPEVNVDKVGIFGRMVNKDQVLRAGDRIEIYRPLKVDPRDRRRKNVEKERKEQKKA